jgi:unsaturated rhamnogalacturonyl hydrolase
LRFQPETLKLVGFILFAGLLSCSKPNSKSPKIAPAAEHWSVKMAESVIKRCPEPWNLEPGKQPRWEYTYGLVLKAILEVWRLTGDDRYFQYVKAYYDHFIDQNGIISQYQLDEYNIDWINPGKSLFLLFHVTQDERYAKAIQLLRSQMQTHPRTSEGGFWHKLQYPHQMWLDGIYMAAPFLAQYARTYHEPELLNDVARQIILMEKHARDEKTGLLYHGWDESRQQRWADPTTGTSPNFWGRALGWYAMALVDVLDFFPSDHPQRSEIIAILSRLAEAVVHYQDQETGLWYQIVDQGGKEGNYRESSASCMLVYALAKGTRLGYLNDKYAAAARHGYNGILKYFITVDATGLVTIHQGCAVAGLGGDPYRDGSYEYYIAEKVVDNDPKAVGPFILASIEFELNKSSIKN